MNRNEVSVMSKSDQITAGKRLKVTEIKSRVRRVVFLFNLKWPRCSKAD